VSGGAEEGSAPRARPAAEGRLDEAPGVAATPAPQRALRRESARGARAQMLKSVLESVPGTLAVARGGLGKATGGGPPPVVAAWPASRGVWLRPCGGVP
jgi:hypothetical protein